MSTPVQSSLIPLKISFDAGVTYKPLVCLENYTIETTTSTSGTDTFCGHFIGIGAITSKVSGSAVSETTPTAQQVTQKDMQQAQAAGTLVYIQADYPTSGSIGGQISNNGQGYVTAVGQQFAVNNLAKYTFTIDVNGTLL